MNCKDSVVKISMLKEGTEKVSWLEYKQSGENGNEIKLSGREIYKPL